MAKSIKVGIMTQAEDMHLPDYFETLAKIEEVEGVAVSDPSGKSAEAARKVLGAKLLGVYQDHTEMLKKTMPQMMIVSVEAVASPPLIDAALESGCHIYAEKPSCVRSEDYVKLARKAQAKHRHLMMALANRSHAPVVEARRLIKTGKLGKVFGVESHLVTDQTRLKSEENRKKWYYNKAKAGGGELTWVGILWLDLILFMTGLKIKQVSGFAGNVGGQPVDIEDSVAMTMRFDNDSFGTLTSGYYLDKGYQSFIQIWGEHGWLRLSSVEETPLEWYSTKDEKEPKVQLFEYPKGSRGYLTFIRAAVRASAGLEEPPISTDEGLHLIKSVYAFYDAAKTGRTQTID
jgi:UDP-N-acetyl-2-amino-2-deoxyglucuronate dehydrogenase